MKILHIIPTLRMGGAEKMLIDTLEEMARQGVECELIVLTNEKHYFEEKLLELGIIIYYASSKSIYDFKNIVFIKKIIKHGRYDCIHTHLFSAQLFTAIANRIAKRKVPLITTEHSTNNRRRENKIFYYLDSWMYKQYNQIIAITEGTRSELVNYLEDTKTKTVVIYNGIQFSHYEHAEVKEKAWETIENEIVVVMVASMRTEKDHKTLIRASHLLPKNYRIVFVGDGECEEEIKSYAGKYGRETIVFLGARLDVPAILKSSDIFVLSSKWEGFGLVVVEAAVTGLPVVASNVSGLKEIVQNVSGLLFEPGNEYDLAEKIQKTTHLIPQNDIKYLEKYHIKNMVFNYIKLYTSLIQ